MAKRVQASVAPTPLTPATRGPEDPARPSSDARPGPGVSDAPRPTSQRRSSAIKRVWAPGELNAFVNEHALPAREDDTCVLESGSGLPWRVATAEEMIAFTQRHLRRQHAGE
ncbi:MAG: hypothetical protein NVSMB32_00530 [Actinomycetota bacterium]